MWKIVAVTTIVFLLACTSPVPAQDPATVAAAAQVIGLGLKIADYFNTKEKDKQLEEIKTQLSEIKAQLKEIDSKLDDIMRKLGALEVKFDEKFDEEQRTKVLSIVDTIATNYEAWISDPKDSSAATAFLNLQTETNNLMHRDTFANYQTVAIAMLVQRDMMVVLRSAPVLRRNQFASFEKYFKNAADPSIKQSLAFRHAAMQSEVTRLAATLNSGASYVCTLGSQYKHCCGQGQTCEYFQARRVVGSADDEFQLVGTQFELQVGGPGPSQACVSHDRVDHPKMFGSHITFSMMVAAGEARACPAELNNIRSERFTDIDRDKLLTDATRVANAFEGIAKTLRLEAENKPNTPVVPAVLK